MNQDIVQNKYELAKKQIDEFKKWRNMTALSFLKLGEILKKLKEEELYKHLGESPEYETWTMFLQSPEINIKYRKADQLIRIYTTFIQRLKFKEEELLDIPWSALRVLLPVIKEENSRGLVEKARQLKRNDLEIEIHQLQQGMESLDDVQKCKHRWRKITYWKCNNCGETSSVEPGDGEIIE